MGLKERYRELIEALQHVFSASNIIDEEWLRLPTKQEYMAEHAGSVLDAEGIACHYCGSSDIGCQPLASARGRRYKHYCNACKRTLYRSNADY